jgi:very-short-patch-repair endonuclease
LKTQRTTSRPRRTRDEALQNDPRFVSLARELRRNATSAESILWRELQNRRFVEFKFRRQQNIGAFIADFYCSKLALVIELDGDSHLGREARDGHRQAWLESKGIRVLRIFNVDLHDNLDGVMEQISRECLARLPAPSSNFTSEITTTPEDIR